MPPSTITTIRRALISQFSFCNLLLIFLLFRSLLCLKDFENNTNYNINPQQLQTKQEEEEECHALFGSRKVSATSIRGGGNAKNLAFSNGSSNQKPRHLNTTEIAHIFMLAFIDKKKMVRFQLLIRAEKLPCPKAAHTWMPKKYPNSFCVVSNVSDVGSVLGIKRKILGASEM